MDRSVISCLEALSQVESPALLPKAPSEVQDHIAHCPTCPTKIQHFDIILNKVREIPPITLPPSLREHPFSNASSYRFDPENKKPGRSQRWKNTPWLIRTGLEGVGAVALILGLVAIVPRVRLFYEKRIERSMGDLGSTGISPDLELLDEELRRGTLPPSNISPEEAEYVADDFNSSEGDPEDSETSDALDGSEEPSPALTANPLKATRVGRSEIWRFHLKTDSPKGLRPKIIHIIRTELKKAGETTDPAGIGGIEAPGGIQFNVLVPATIISNLRSELPQLVNSTSEPQTEADRSRRSSLAEKGAPFTWYRNKSKRALPEGRARLVIWLSQI